MTSHAWPFASPCVMYGAVGGCVRGALPGCASPVLAIGGAHLLSVPRLCAGPVDAAQSDRVPEMPSRRLVASALIRPMVKLRVRSLCRRHLHPYPCRLPSRSEPARCRLLHDFAHTTSRGEALTPLAPRRPSHPHPKIESPGSPLSRPLEVGTQTLRHEPLSPLPVSTPSTPDTLSQSRLTVAPTDLCPIGAGERDLGARRAPVPAGVLTPLILRQGSSSLDESFATVDAVGISRTAPLRVLLLGAPSGRDLPVHDFPAVRTEPHRHDGAPVIVIGATFPDHSHSSSSSSHSPARRRVLPRAARSHP